MGCFYFIDLWMFLSHRKTFLKNSSAGLLLEGQRKAQTIPL